MLISILYHSFLLKKSMACMSTLTIKALLDTIKSDSLRHLNGERFVMFYYTLSRARGRGSAYFYVQLQ